jgi:glutathione synthase/RimK-type ligase-like ATP-grasp enzyme
MILVISYPAEEHTDAVVARLANKGCEVQQIDLADFPARQELTFNWPADHEPPAYWVGGSAGTVDLSRVRAAWWRRVTPFMADDAIKDPNAQAFAVSETSEAMNGMLDALPCKWMNPRAADDAAHHKPYQWTAAKEVGLQLPRTLVTTDPAAARRFIEEIGVGKVVYKAFLAMHEAWRETRLVKKEDLDRLELVRLAPVIFQEYIAGVDLRIIAVGDQLFTAEIDARDTAYPVDMRMVIGESHVRPVELPKEVHAALTKLQKRLGLLYGAIDVRRTDEGAYYFLEVNPAGQWMFVETRTGLPISQAVADYLEKMTAA